MRSKWLRLLAVLFAFSLFAAACGDDSSEGGDTAGDDGGDTDGDTGGDTGGDAEDDTAGDTDGDDGGDTDGDTDGDDGGDTDGDTGGDDGEMAANCDATVVGTQINYGVYVGGRSFDPPYSSGALVGGTELVAVYDALMRFNPDTGDFEPHLAEGMESNEDFTVWTLTLRPDIAFDDGTPLDADMVLANIDRFFEPVGDQTIINTSPAFLQFIESSAKVDDLTIEFTLSQPWADFPFVFNDEPGYIINVNAVGDDPVAFGALPPPAAGVGPYIVESNTPGEDVIMKARDNYWGGPVCVETLRFDLAAASAITGAPASYEAFQNGDLDIAFLRNATTIAQVKADGAPTSLAYQDAGAMLIFNMGEGSTLSDPVLREAVALAIDPDVLNERAYEGNLDTGKSMVLDASPYYSSDIVEMETDVDRAAELVTESGFTGTLRILCATGPEATEVALATQALLSNVGITATVENLGTTDQIAKMVTGDYDIGCWGFNAGPDTAVTSFVRNLGSESASNRQGLKDPDMDELLSAALAAPKDGRSAALAAINNKYVGDFLGVPFGALEEGVVINPELMGVKQTGSTIYMFDDAYFVE